MRIQLAIAAVLAGGAVAALIAWESVREPPAGENVYNRLASHRYFRERMRDFTPITDYAPPATAPESSGAASMEGIRVTPFPVPGGVRAFLRPEEIVDDRLVEELRKRFDTDADVKRAIEVQRAALMSLSEHQLLLEILNADPALLKLENQTEPLIRKTLLYTAINPMTTVLAWQDRSVFAVTYAQSAGARESTVIVFQFDDDGKLILNARVNIDAGTPTQRVRAAITALTRPPAAPAVAPTSAPSP